LNSAPPAAAGRSHSRRQQLRGLTRPTDSNGLRLNYFTATTAAAAAASTTTATAQATADQPREVLLSTTASNTDDNNNHYNDNASVGIR
jgi:hypothetical protein